MPTVKLQPRVGPKLTPQPKVVSKPPKLKSLKAKRKELLYLEKRIARLSKSDVSAEQLIFLHCRAGKLRAELPSPK